MKALLCLAICVTLLGCATQPARERVSKIMESRGAEAPPPVQEQSLNDYIHPSPTRALLYSTFFPGGGYFYLAGEPVTNPSKYSTRGAAFLIAEVAAFFFAQSQVKKDSSNAMLYVLPLGVKIFEFDSTVLSAEKEHFANSQRK